MGMSWTFLGAIVLVILIQAGMSMFHYEKYNR